MPDECAKPKRHFIRFLPPLANIKLNLFQFGLNRVTTEALPPAREDSTGAEGTGIGVEDLSISSRLNVLSVRCLTAGGASFLARIVRGKVICTRKTNPFHEFLKEIVLWELHKLECHGKSNIVTIVYLI